MRVWQAVPAAAGSVQPVPAHACSDRPACARGCETRGRTVCAGTRRDAALAREPVRQTETAAARAQETAGPKPARTRVQAASEAAGSEAALLVPEGPGAKRPQRRGRVDRGSGSRVRVKGPSPARRFPWQRRVKVLLRHGDIQPGARLGCGAVGSAPPGSPCGRAWAQPCPVGAASLCASVGPDPERRGRRKPQLGPREGPRTVTGLPAAPCAAGGTNPGVTPALPALGHGQANSPRADTRGCCCCLPEPRRWRPAVSCAPRSPP